MQIIHDIQVIGDRSHGGIWTDKVKGRVCVDVEDADKAERIVQLYRAADRVALEIMTGRPFDG